jgi:hypothetical protein
MKEGSPRNFSFVEPSQSNKLCALGAATLMLPVLANADHDSGKGNNGDNDGRRWGEKDEPDTDRDRDRKIPVVPEASAGWMLIPFFGAVLLFSWRHFSRSKA